MSLTHIEQKLLEAIGAAAHGAKVRWTDPLPTEEWDELMALAAAHKILPLVYEAIYACPAAESWAHKAYYKNQAIRQVAIQTGNSAEFLRLYHALAEKGLHPLVVKGIVCRNLYPNGDNRPSGDEDVYIADNEFVPCCQAMRELGMIPSGDVEETALELGWHKANSALRIEVHRRLFASDTQVLSDLNRFFEASFDTAEQYDLNEGESVYSLSPQDHLLYLLLHAYKHFVHSGIGIRQICDIALWAQKYGDRIDWDELYRNCSEAHALLFAAALFQIGREFLDITLPLPQCWEAIEVDSRPLLLDILRGGAYGTADKSRQHSAGITLNAVENGHGRKRAGVLRAIFPPGKQLRGTYPVLKRYPILLPTIWAIRLAKYGREVLHTDHNSAAESLRIAKERLELLKRYEMVDR